MAQSDPANNPPPRKQVAWVTGASTGIGAALCRRLAKDGWIVCATARSKDKLDALAKDADGRTAGSILPFPGDVTRPKDMASIVAVIENDHGPIALAVLNAGMFVPETLAHFSADTFKTQIDLNLTGTANCLEAVLPRFCQRNSGHVALVASVAGYRGLPRSLAYGASKAGLINMAEAMAIMTQGSGIKVQVINPGFVRTPLTDRNDFPMPFIISAERAADCIARGLASRKFEITFPMIFSLSLKILGLLPDRLYFAAMALANRKEAERGNQEKHEGGR